VVCGGTGGGAGRGASTLLNRVFDLSGVRVTGLDLGAVDGTGQVVVDLALRARLLACPACSFTTSRRYDRRDVDSSWRHLDLGGRVCRLRMRRRRLRCPTHGVVTQNVPFARPGARFTADFEDLVVWLVTCSDKTTVATFAQVAWRTVGRCASGSRPTSSTPTGRRGWSTSGLMRSRGASTTST
jgi:hypothetical protein